MDSQQVTQGHLFFSFPVSCNVSFIFYKILEFFLYKVVKSCDQCGGSILDLKTMKCLILTDVQYTMLHTKYINYRLYGVQQECFYNYVSNCKIFSDPWDGAFFDQLEMTCLLSPSYNNWRQVYIKYTFDFQ